MNRIICDICGSEYPETSDRCPICSYPRQGTEKMVAASAEAVQAKVKGGRFSSKNVKKRRKAQLKAEKAERADGEKDPNKPLIIVIIVLLIAILLVALYIGARFFLARDAYQPPQKTTAPTTSVPTETTVPPTIPCAGIVLESSVLDLETLGEQKQLQLQLVPGDTTDTVTYVSADPAVAEISETGLITAVGSGQTAVTVTCGDVSKTCTVVCWFQEETTAPPETAAPTEAPKATEAPKPTQPKATEPKPTKPKETEPKATEPAELTLDKTDMSFFEQNQSYRLSVKLGGESVSRSKVTWTSSAPDVATVENGTVTAVGKGTATITAEYQGKKTSCIVRCQFADTSWKASASDVTMGVGDSFRLTVTNNSGEKADAIWTMNKEGIVSIDGSTVTAHAPGTVTLTATVDGVTMTCIVRVK